MKNKMHRKANLSKMFFTLLFGLSTVLSFGQVPDPPPDETPIDNNILILFIAGLLFSAIFFFRKIILNAEKK